MFYYFFDKQEKPCVPDGAVRGLVYYIASFRFYWYHMIPIWYFNGSDISGGDNTNYIYFLVFFYCLDFLFFNKYNGNRQVLNFLTLFYIFKNLILVCSHSGFRCRKLYIEIHAEKHPIIFNGKPPRHLYRVDFPGMDFVICCVEHGHVFRAVTMWNTSLVGRRLNVANPHPVTWWNPPHKS